MEFTNRLDGGEREEEHDYYMLLGKNYKIALTVCALILAGLIFDVFLLKNRAKASSLKSSVVIYICGDGIIESPEVCDDGVNNGRYAYNAADKFCNATCSNWAPYCGDGVTQSEYGEECDDGNNISGDGCSPICKTEEYSPPSGGGGGGFSGSGNILPAQKTDVIIKGRAYAGAKITLLKDGKVSTIKKADNLGNFSMEAADITPGLWTFSLWAEDKKGRKSITFSFTTNVQKGMTTTISGVFLPPTIELSKVNLKKGEILDISGQTSPGSLVIAHIESQEIIKTSTSTGDGDWDIKLSTNALGEGVHTARAKAKSRDNLESSFSQVLAFYVGSGTKWENRQADINRDGRVNLVDFSILLYNWGVSKSPSADLNSDGKVNLTDFSIMMYYWTG